LLFIIFHFWLMPAADWCWRLMMVLWMHSGYDLFVLGLQESYHAAPVDLMGNPLWGTSNDFTWLAAFTQHLDR